jgi:hypothetical protein
VEIVKGGLIPSIHVANTLLYVTGLLSINTDVTKCQVALIVSENIGFGVQCNGEFPTPFLNGRILI